MTLTEEIEILDFTHNIITKLFDRTDIGTRTINLSKDEHLYIETNSSTNKFHVSYRRNGKGNYELLFGFDCSDYTNMRAGGGWTLNFWDESDPKYFADTYSVLNDGDAEEPDPEEKRVDDLLDERRIMTEEEYFQSSLLHSSMPDTYEDMLTILERMHNRDTSVLTNVCTYLYFDDYVDMHFMRRVRRALELGTGIKLIG